MGDRSQEKLGGGVSVARFRGGGQEGSFTHLSPSPVNTHSLRSPIFLARFSSLREPVHRLTRAGAFVRFLWHEVTRSITTPPPGRDAIPGQDL